MTINYDEIFNEAVACEDADPAKAQSLYALLSDNPCACVNLGVLKYKSKLYAEAEMLFRKAVEIAPVYALAWFNLGNALDSQLHDIDAASAYKRAIEILPDYADAHYNLAIVYDRLKERRKALKHWSTYAKLDKELNGVFHRHAKRRVKNLLAEEPLKLVG